MGPIPIAGLAALGVIISAVLTFLAVKWKLSGRIDTTEANVLWTATESLRRDLAEQLKEREAVIIRQTARMLQCDLELSNTRRERDEANNKSASLERRREALEQRLQRAEDKIKELKGGGYGEQRKPD